MTISLDLLKIGTDENVYKRGNDYFKKHPYNSLSFQLNSNQITISAQIKEYDTLISYDIHTGNVLKSVCTCKYNQTANKICKHIITLTMQINKKLQTAIPNIDLLDTYQKQETILENIITLNTNFQPQNVEETSLTVSQITNSIKNLLEQNQDLNNVLVNGEISTFSPNRSGHIYFSIKDDYSLLSCVMFKTSANQLNFEPKTGDKVLLKGKITLYEPRGTYQLLVKEMKRQGQGDLYQQFIELKEKLQLKGYFDEQHKRAIPHFPTSIGVITSETGAVIQDIKNTIKRRFPKIKLILYPATVQGEGCEQTIIKGIKYFNKQEEKIKPDTLIIARGGGSIEDLWNFNSEQLALEIFNSQIPIISAIGHETDFTITDFVSDLRAPTPTAAAELSTPNLFDLNYNLSNQKRQLIKSLNNNLENKKLDINNKESTLYTQLEHNLQTQKHKLENFKQKLKLLSINSTLKRGFSLTLDENGKSISNTKNLKEGNKITTLLNKGKIVSTVDKIKEN